MIGMHLIVSKDKINYFISFEIILSPTWEFALTGIILWKNGTCMNDFLIANLILFLCCVKVMYVFIFLVKFG